MTYSRAFLALGTAIVLALTVSHVAAYRRLVAAAPQAASLVRVVQDVTAPRRVEP